MVETKTISDLEEYYNHVREEGLLLADKQARLWSRGTLNMLGVNLLDRKVKKKLAKALPPELSRDLGKVFWLLHFPNPNLSAEEFQQRVARRSGNTDADFARHPIIAVFGGLKRLIGRDLSNEVKDALSPDLQELWEAG